MWQEGAYTVSRMVGVFFVDVDGRDAGKRHCRNRLDLEIWGCARDKDMRMQSTALGHLMTLRAAETVNCTKNIMLNKKQSFPGESDELLRMVELDK